MYERTLCDISEAVRPYGCATVPPPRREEVMSSIGRGRGFAASTAYIFLQYCVRFEVLGEKIYPSEEVVCIMYVFIEGGI